MIKYEHTTGPLLADYCSYRQYRCLQTKSYTISLSLGNNCILTAEGHSTLVQNILSPDNDGTIVLMCQRYITAEDAFSYPLPSSQLGICKVDNKLSALYALPLSSVAKKCAVLPMKDDFVAFPLLH